MKFTVLGQVSTRSRDGRVFSAMDGTESEVDDVDTDMCDAIRALPASLIEIHEEQAPAAPPAAPAVVGSADDVSELDSLRAQAEAMGIKVDRRWGADRLRDEIAAAAGAE